MINYTGGPVYFLRSSFRSGQKGRQVQVMEGRPFESPIATTVATARISVRMLRMVRWLASGGMVLGTVWAVAVAESNKQALDVYPLAMVAWLGVSFLAIRRTRRVDGYIVVTVALLIADALADVLAQGAWLHGPWALLNVASQMLLGAPLIAEWRWDLGATANLATYNLAFWMIAVSLRGVALVAGVVEGILTRGVTPSHGWLWVPVLLVLGTATLFLGHVADVLRFMLLGYPPFLRHAPLDFANLSPLFGFTWNTRRVDALAGLSAIAAGLLFARAITLDRRQLTGPSS